ncbi:MAG: Trk family potassium uptake protein, partial [SAR202 cluster bacterium]|nr:Trk family potassium uptake protein [SAR202 cluster bacterium]
MTNSRRGPGRGAAGPSRPRLADVVVRRRRLRELAPVVVNLSLPRPPTRNASSPLFLVYGFLGLILAGTGLLMLPQANTLHAVPPFNVAFFTATSAVTVTGLTLVDTPTYWSAVGHVIIVTLIGIGGLGWMTMAGFILVAAGQRMTLPRRMALRQAV